MLLTYLEWLSILGPIALGVLIVAYFLGLKRHSFFASKASFDPLDQQTLRLLKDLESKAREFDQFIAEKIFEEEQKEQGLEGQEWVKNNQRPKLRLIKQSSHD